MTAIGESGYAYNVYYVKLDNPTGKIEDPGSNSNSEANVPSALSLPLAGSLGVTENTN